ncbi:hypothetical protein N9599_02185 [Candidatus Pelagibacter sp.]|jgi:hypothetical protein|nr:hypothetical protein [Candidatus Pelagibacter sp.]|tara:strand:- start:530 stop:688 length:159 start_codon:yes stop_codon:yes gene_type:complete
MFNGKKKFIVIAKKHKKIDPKINCFEKLYRFGSKCCIRKYPNGVNRTNTNKE